MNMPDIPEDIQILLDCIEERSDLDLEEMKPLKAWLEQSVDGASILSLAISQNAQLRIAIEQMEVRVPKALHRQVSSYVEMNSGPDEDELNVRENRDRLKAEHNRANRWFNHYWVRTIAGGLTAAAIMAVVAYSVVFALDYLYQLDANALCQKGEAWIEDTLNHGEWENVSAEHIENFPLPSELRVTATSTAMFHSREFGKGRIYEVHTSAGPAGGRGGYVGYLVVLKTRKRLEHSRLTQGSHLRINNYDLGAAKNENGCAYVLAASGNYNSFVMPDPLGKIVTLLRLSWSLC